MKKTITLLVVLFFLMLTLSATERKKVKKSFPVQPGQAIEINTVSGLELKVNTWDKNEVSFNLAVKIMSSDKDYEDEYIEEFDITDVSNDSELILDFVEAGNGGWSFWDIFRLKFHYYIEKNIEGEIYVPKNNSLRINTKYSNITISDVQGELNFNSRGNSLVLQNCGDVREIENNYGDVTIKNCSGKLDLNSKSSKIIVEGFSGATNIDANYSEIEVSDISGYLNILTRSAEVDIGNIGGDLKLNADYSNVRIKNIEGFAEIGNRSGAVKINSVGGLKINAPYTELDIENIRGTIDRKIEISNYSGEIKINKAVGDLFINDSYSDIKLAGIKGNIMLFSRSSTIEAENIVGSWTSDTEYCAISVLRINASKLMIDNRSNPVSVTFINNPDTVEIENNYGDVDIKVPSNYEAEILLFATYGSIETDIPLRLTSQGSSENAVGRIGTRKATMTIETHSADIKIKTH